MPPADVAADGASRSTAFAPRCAACSGSRSGSIAPPISNRCCTVVLEALEDYFEFSHTSVLLLRRGRPAGWSRLASRGYGQSGVGAEVALGQGLIGTVARERRLLRLTSLDGDLRYGRAIRREAAARRDCAARTPKSRCPGCPTRRACSRFRWRLAIVWSACCGRGSRPDALRRVARGVSRDHRQSDRARHRSHARPRRTIRPSTCPSPAAARAAAACRRAADRRAARRRRRLTYYKNDDAIFVDDEYLIRNVAGAGFCGRCSANRSGPAAPSSRTARCASTRRSACRRSRTTSRAG